MIPAANSRTLTQKAPDLKSRCSRILGRSPRSRRRNLHFPDHFCTFQKPNDTYSLSGEFAPTFRGFALYREDPLVFEGSAAENWRLRSRHRFRRPNPPLSRVRESKLLCFNTESVQRLAESIFTSTAVHRPARLRRPRRARFARLPLTCSSSANQAGRSLPYWLLQLGKFGCYNWASRKNSISSAHPRRCLSRAAEFLNARENGQNLPRKIARPREVGCQFCKSSQTCACDSKIDGSQIGILDGLSGGQSFWP